VILMSVGVALRAEDLALIVSTPIADAVIATVLLTRIKVKPGAFSPGLLAVLFGTILLGAVVSSGVWLFVAAIGDSTSLLVAVQLVAVACLSIGICVVGLAAVTRMARGFRFA